MNNQQTPPNEEQFEIEGEGEITPQDTELEDQGSNPLSEDEGTSPTEPVEEENTTPNYYTPEEMKTLQVDGIDTSRIPPEMIPLYQAMQSPITRKSQELSQKLNELEQGQIEPLQDTQQATTPNTQPSIEDMAMITTLQKLGLQEKPEAWDPGYEMYIMELADTRRDLKETATKQAHAMAELNTFKAGFTPEQFQTIDQEAETKMYKLLSDPSTRAEGQRIQQAVQTGDTNTLLSFVRDVAKEVLSSAPQANQSRTTPPVTSAPQGNVNNTGVKDPSKMTAEEYRAYREASM